MFAIRRKKYNEETRNILKEEAKNYDSLERFIVETGYESWMDDYLDCTADDEWSPWDFKRINSLLEEIWVEAHKEEK